MAICLTDVNANLGGEEVLDGVRLCVCACLEFILVEVNAGFELIWLRDALLCECTFSGGTDVRSWLQQLL